MNQTHLSSVTLQKNLEQARRHMASMSANLKDYQNYQALASMSPHQQQMMLQSIATGDLNGAHLLEQSASNLPPHHSQQHSQQQQSSTSDLDNTNLYIKGLWKDCTQVELDDLFKQFGVISQSRVYGDGVGFVRFEQGFEAKAAIEAMDKKRLDRCPDQLLVKYAFKKQRGSKRYIRVNDEIQHYEVEMIMNKNTNNVYLRCLPRGFTEPQLIELCEPYGELTCTRLRESGVAFVRYRKEEDAQKAIRQLNGKRFEDHNETLLAKLANSDPFQPKIGFKQSQQGRHGGSGHNGQSNDDDMSSVADSMTPSVPVGGSMQYAHNPHGSANPSESRRSNGHINNHSRGHHDRSNGYGHSRHHEQYGHHAQYGHQHHAQSSHAPPTHHSSHGYGHNDRYSSHGGPRHHQNPPRGGHHQPSPYGAPPPQQQHNPYAQPYDQRGMAPSTHTAASAYNPYARPQSPPQPYNDPRAQQPAQPQQPTYAASTTTAAPSTLPAHTAYYPAASQPIAAHGAYPYYQAYYQPAATVAAYPSQPMPPAYAHAYAQPPPQTTQSTAHAATPVKAQTDPRTPDLLSPNRQTSDGVAAAVAAAATLTPQTSHASQVGGVKSPTPQTTQTVPATLTPQTSQTPAAPQTGTHIFVPPINTPSPIKAHPQSLTHALSPATPQVLYVPVQVHPGMGVVNSVPHGAAVGLPIHSPAGSVSALSFRDMHMAPIRPSSEISSIAGHAASEIIAKQSQLLSTTQPKIAGANSVGVSSAGVKAPNGIPNGVSIPVTPEQFKSPFEMTSLHNLGQLSPSLNQTRPAHQTWQLANSAGATQAHHVSAAAMANVTAAMANATLSPPVGNANKIASEVMATVNAAVNAANTANANGMAAAAKEQTQQSIDNAVNEAQLAIVKESAQPTATVAVSGSSETKKEEDSRSDTSKGQSTSKSAATLGSGVTKKTANQLYSVIAGWYPKQAPKLAGMLMANHTEKNVARYLRHEDKLREKLKKYMDLLSTQKPTTE